jgi:hypothetical protein
MSAREMKLIYDSLTASGDLGVLFPSMIGDWVVDKKEFIIQYNSNERLLEYLDDDDDEDFFDEFSINEDY